MKARYTTEEFIMFLKAVHGDLYNYSKLIYIDSATKIEVICKEHGSFWISPKDHKQGNGCIPCGCARRGKGRRLSAQTFEDRFKSVFGDRLTCDSSQYKTTFKKIDVTCPTHGTFSATPSNLLSGKGCKLCGFIKRGNSLRSNTEDFISKALKVFDGQYSYENTDYIANYKKVDITCKIHGSFMMQPNNHLQGKGCPKCQSYGYNKAKPGTFYILIADNYTKVGITNRAVELRVKPISKSSGQDFKINSTFFFEDGSKAANIETQVLTWLKTKYQPVPEVFDGSTECFLNVNLEELLNFVSPLNSEQIVSQQT